MFTHYSATLVRQTSFDVKWGVKRPFLPQDNEKKYQDITPILSARKKNLSRLLANTESRNYPATSYKTTILRDFGLARQNPYLIKVKSVKNTILENYFEQL